MATVDEDLERKLQRWGMWYHKQSLGLSLSPETIIYSAMTGKLRSGGPWCPDGIGGVDDAIDTGRRIADLPVNLKRVLVAEYIVGGDVRAKTAAADMATSTYYRALKYARSQLLAVPSR